MEAIQRLFDQNRAWSDNIRAHDAQFFEHLSHQQSPAYLWIGCSDSRVPATQIVGLLPGELFVHRNVANLVVHTDLNCLSVMQYAVDVLKVSHIIVCGHYGCGGVHAALRNQRVGLVDNWLRHARDVYEKHEMQLTAIAEESRRWARLGELNVIEQALNVCQTMIVRDCWQRGQSLTVHGWIYNLQDGRLRDMGFCAAQANEVAGAYQAAMRHQMDQG
jgi:carbonic anhydrase